MVKNLVKRLLFKEALAMARSCASDPLQKYKFRISITGISSEMGFQKCSAIKRQVSTTKYMESGYDSEHKLPGRQTVDDVTLEKGMFANKDFENLFLKSLNDDECRFTMTISLCDKHGTPKRSWTLAECLCTAWESSDMDSSSEDVAVEKLTVAYEYLI